MDWAVTKLRWEIFGSRHVGLISPTTPSCIGFGATKFRAAVVPMAEIVFATTCDNLPPPDTECSIEPANILIDHGSLAEVEGARASSAASIVCNRPSSVAVDITPSRVALTSEMYSELSWSLGGTPESTVRSLTLMSTLHGRAAGGEYQGDTVVRVTYL